MNYPTRVIILFFLHILFFPVSGAVSRDRQVYRIIDSTMVSKPVSPLLCSNFIELGYGIQVEPMWGEMLWNRSFEKFIPYKQINIIWFDLWNSHKDHSKGYKWDWRNEDWYHSGYEHNPWFAAPGKAGFLPVNEESTFFINENTGSPVKIEQIPGGIHGSQCILVKNTGSASGAIAQEGKFLRVGENYIFSGHFRSLKGPVTLELRMYPEGEWESPQVTVPFEIPSSDDFFHVKFSFSNKAFTGRATFSLWLPAEAAVQMDALSLMPKNTIAGWRPEAIACASYVKPSVVRFPGGCFASFYNWRDGIGPFDNRKPQPSYFWGGLNYNDVGVAELARFCKAIGSEMMFCVNVYHPSKLEWAHRWDDGTGGKMGFMFPEFTDIEKGARDAADLVAYCNLPAGSHPMADLRVKHGYPEPLGIRYWEMDNEVHRWFAPEAYARAVVACSKAMKKIDPGIKIGLVTYGGRPGQPAFGDKVPEMLEICGQDIDFLADRRDADAGLDKMLGILRNFEKKTGKYIGYCNTEKLFLGGKVNFSDNSPVDPANRSYQFSKWFYAMNVIRSFMSFQRRGGDVWFVNFNNLANTHSQCVMDTPKEGAYVTAPGEALSLLSRSPVAWPLKISNYQAEEKDDFQVQAAWSADKGCLILYVFNRSDEIKSTGFALSELKRTFRTAETTVLNGKENAMNTLKNPDSIKKTVKMQNGLNISSSFDIESSPWSFTQVILY